MNKIQEIDNTCHYYYNNKACHCNFLIIFFYIGYFRDKIHLFFDYEKRKIKDPENIGYPVKQR